MAGSVSRNGRCATAGNLTMARVQAFDPRSEMSENPGHRASGSASGASGVGQMILVNWPRCSSSRPLPPRPVVECPREPLDHRVCVA